MKYGQDKKKIDCFLHLAQLFQSYPIMKRKHHSLGFKLIPAWEFPSLFFLIMYIAIGEHYYLKISLKIKLSSNLGVLLTDLSSQKIRFSVE